MQSKAKTVPAYLKEVPAERRDALKKLRDLCRATLTGFEESMAYGGPSYSRNRSEERRVALPISAYLKEVPAERRDALKKLRDLCRATLTGFEESMAYGGPSYSRNGEGEVGFEIGR